MLDETDVVLRGLLRGSAVDAAQAYDRLAVHCLELYLTSLWARRLWTVLDDRSSGVQGGQLRLCAIGQKATR